MINKTNSFIVCKGNKLIRLSWLRAVTNGRTVKMKSMKMEMSNWTMMYRVRKIDQQEEVLVARTEHLSVPV